MQLSLSGSTGFIGSALKRFFIEKGWTINEITRQSLSLNSDEFLKKKIEGSDVIINLAGAPVQKRWTAAYKNEILQSRVNSTQKIVDAILLMEKKPAVFISASAVGIYDSKNHHTEESLLFSGDFLGKVCRDWEETAMKAQSATRLVILRIGLVLGKDGGMLHKVYPLFSKGLGGKIGNGTQVMSWIHITDLLRVISFIIENKTISGVVNVVSPTPVSNEHFTGILGKVLLQPAFLKVPVFGLKAVYGEAAEMLVTGQTVIPKKLMDHGFEFSFPTIEKALVNLYK
jgi:uncharacterized protein